MNRLQISALTLLAFAVLEASGAGAQTVTVSNGTGPISQTRDFARGGDRASRWTTPAAGNTADHEGRGIDSFDDGGFGEISFAVRAGADGTAVVEFQDVGDARAFDGFTINGELVEIPAPRENGGILRAVLDFGAAGWHQVVAITAVEPGRILDGFSARTCAR